VAKAGAEITKRLRDYAVQEPSYTCAFAAWELGVSTSTIVNANAELIEREIVRQIEPRNGPYGAVYQYRPIPRNGAGTARRRLFAELDEGLSSAPRRGAPIPHTGQADGRSGKPGADRKKQAAGRRLKPQRGNT
jgi:hypothetical protein